MWYGLEDLRSFQQSLSARVPRLGTTLESRYGLPVNSSWEKSLGMESASEAFHAPLTLKRFIVEDFLLRIP